MNQPSVFDFYRGKHIFITGSTGFVGKVLLEKYLRALPEIGRLYVLIRGKKGSNVNERFKKEILGSQCFDRLKKLKGYGFDDYINEKVLAVEGDLLKDSLGLSSEDEQMLCENLHVIINCAASVDFNASIVDSLQINYFGTQKVLNLARKCKHLENFSQISTAYVNSDKLGFIEEKIYNDLPQDVEKTVQDLLIATKNFTEKQTLALIGRFPNTYTYTKNLTEKMLLKLRPKDMQLTIIRPTIVGSSFRDPFPGWIDNMIGSAAINFYSGIGLVKIFRGNQDLIGDQIPVDFVCDHIIVSTAFMANKSCFEVMHIGSSSRNPVKWRVTGECCREYWNKNIPTTKVSRCTVEINPSPLYYKMKNLGRTIPALLYKSAANVLGDEKMKKDANRYLKFIEKAHLINEAYIHFNNNEWIFDSEKIKPVIDYLSPQEKEVFLIDVQIINWRSYLLNLNYGLQKFILKENVDPPGDPQVTDLFTLFDEQDTDLKWARKQGFPFKTKSKKEITTLILNSQRVQQVMFQIQKERMKKHARISHDPEKVAQQHLKQINQEALDICNQLFADYSFKVIRMIAYMFNKIFKQIYEKLVLDESYLSQLSAHDQKSNGPLIFVPTHKSYVDFLIASYIFYAFKIQCPHVAATEDFLQMSIIPQILRSCGAFFLKRQQYEDNILYKTIFYEYVQRLLQDDCYLEFFVEGTRSRTGKVMNPKFGLLGIVVDTVIEKKIPDATLIPMTINYEKVLEADTYPLELLGENKVKESLLRVLRAGKIMSSNQGRVYVEFGEPISIQSMLKQKKQSQQNFDPIKNPRDRLDFNEDVGNNLVATLIDKLIVMPTSMVAALILMHRKGIQEKDLVKKIQWLSNEIQSRGGRIGSINDCSFVISVRNSINHLKTAVVKTKKDMFELQVTPNLEYKNFLLLNYYKNQLLHIFFQEALTACTLNSFGQQIAFKEGIKVTRLWEEGEFLHNLLNHELIVRNPVKSFDQFSSLVQYMVQKFTLVYTTQTTEAVKVHPQAEFCMFFLCSLIWPLLESYWVTLVFIYSLQKNQTQITVKRLIQQIQWFAESMYEERVVECYECCSFETITNAVQYYHDVKVISIEKELNEKSQQIDEYVRVIYSDEKILDLELYIKKFMKDSFTKSVKTSIEYVNKNIIDFPIMAKL